MATTFRRIDGRRFDELRPVKITRNFLKWPEGSVLIEMGDTKVIVTASIEKEVPRFLQNSGKGWITAEYDMIPRATNTRRARDRSKNIPGRTMEIQRLIGRGIRAAFDFDTMGEITVKIDADVIQADGGTRCASITGGFIAVYDALQRALKDGTIPTFPDFQIVTAVSVGLVQGLPILDLCYKEDSQADVDMNIIMDEEHKFAEIQGTGEGRNFSNEELTKLIQLGETGCVTLIQMVKKQLNLE